jgi:putative addiction module CopG family antidote
MNITLNPAVEKLVRERIERGDYENADILVEEAVSRLLQEDHAEHEALRQTLQEGIDDLERGSIPITMSTQSKTWPTMFINVA